MDLRDRAFQTLTGAGLTVKLPAAKPGKCTEPYLVVQDGGQENAGRGRLYKYVIVNGYVPEGRQRELAPLMTRARGALQGTRVFIAVTRSPEEVNDQFQAISMAEQYRALCAAP